MARTLTINAAQIIQLATTYSAASDTATTTALYTVGNVANGTYVAYQGAAQSGIAALTLPGATPINAGVQQLAALIAQQEGLDLAGGDQVLTA